MKDYERITDDDLEEFQKEFGAHLTRELMDEVITTADPYRGLLHRGRMWGWSDTEVREEVWTVMQGAPERFESSSA